MAGIQTEGFPYGSESISFGYNVVQNIYGGNAGRSAVGYPNNPGGFAVGISVEGTCTLDSNIISNVYGGAGGLGGYGGQGLAGFATGVEIFLFGAMTAVSNTISNIHAGPGGNSSSFSKAFDFSSLPTYVYGNNVSNITGDAPYAYYFEVEDAPCNSSQYGVGFCYPPSPCCTPVCLVPAAGVTCRNSTNTTGICENTAFCNNIGNCPCTTPSPSPSPSNPKSGSHNNNKKLIIGVAVGVGGFILIVVGIILVYKLRHKWRKL